VSSIDRAFLFVSIGIVAIAISGVAFLAGFDNTLTTDTSKKPVPVTSQQEDETTVFQQGLSPQMKLNSNKLQPGVSSAIKIVPKEDIPIPLDATEVVFHKCSYYREGIAPGSPVMFHCPAIGITPEHNIIATLNSRPTEFYDRVYLEYAKAFYDRVEIKLINIGSEPLTLDSEVSIIAFK